MQHNSKCFDSQEQLPNFVHLLSRSIAIQQLRHVAEPDHRWTLLKKKLQSHRIHCLRASCLCQRIASCFLVKKDMHGVHRPASNHSLNFTPNQYCRWKHHKNAHCTKVIWQCFARVPAYLWRFAALFFSMPGIQCSRHWLKPESEWFMYVNPTTCGVWQNRLVNCDSNTWMDDDGCVHRWTSTLAKDCHGVATLHVTWRWL